MRRFYSIARIVGYTAGVGGLILLFVGRTMTGESLKTVKQVGMGLVIVMFCSFVLSYFLFTVMKFKQRSQSGRPFRVE